VELCVKAVINSTYTHTHRERESVRNVEPSIQVKYSGSLVKFKGVVCLV